MKFYATVDSDSIRSYMPNVPILLPASSWAQKKHKRLLAPVRLPSHLTDRAADCGGFVATKIWGDYRYTPAQYVDWLTSFGPTWAATMDYCCEDEITTGNMGIVKERQHRTTEMAWHFWEEYRAVPWTWVPTVQGWTVPQYRGHARELWYLIQQMQAHYGRAGEFRVGIGTLCARADVATIIAVVQAVGEELPGVPLHLWGVKLGALKSRVALPDSVVSADSAAWNSRFGEGIESSRDSDMTQREYSYKVALPAYLAKFERAVAGTKQTALSFASEEVA